MSAEAAERQRLRPRERLGALGRYLRILGPGLITGASDDDPSGISTYSVAGASAGFSMLWIVLLTTPMMAVVQGMCARIGMVTGVGLATVMRKRLPLWVVWPLGASVVIANLINAGADLEGMAASAAMVTHIPDLVWTLLFGVLLAGAQVLLPYKTIFEIVKWLTISLFAYVITAFIVHPAWPNVLQHLVVPTVRFDASWFTTLMAVLGTTITPYLFFWQACLMVEEERAMGRKTVRARRGATTQEIADAHLDANVGMIFSNLVAFFIIVTTASTLFATGHRDIRSAQDAAEALRPLAGDAAAWLFTVGMVATGLLAIPALVGSSAYVVAEMLALPEGLNQPFRKAKGFYIVLILGMVVAMAMGAVHIDPIRALFWSAVLNGIVAVPLLVVVVAFASSKRIMGRWTSSIAARIWGWGTVAVMTVAAISIFAFWGKS